MDRKQLYDGVKCDKCEYWFSKLYLFKQHSRRSHNDFCEFIDLPLLSSSIPSLLQIYGLEDELLFALLHIYNEKSVLMRVFRCGIHAIMRFANQDDLMEQQKRLTKQGKQGMRITVIFDIYQTSEYHAASFNMVSRIFFKENKNAQQPPPVQTERDCTKNQGQKWYPCKFIFPTSLEKSAITPERIPPSQLNLGTVPNLFCIELERIIAGL